MTEQPHKPEGSGLASFGQSHKSEDSGLASSGQSHKPEGSGLASSGQSQKEETLFILKELEAKANITQRDLSSRLNISLGKTNYLLRELILKGFIKVKNFTGNPGKLRKIHYLLTEKGLEEKFRLLNHFLQIKEVEYNKLKQESDLLMKTYGGQYGSK